MTTLTDAEIGEILDLLIDEKITDWDPDPTEFAEAIEQVHDRYRREHNLPS